MHHFMPHLPKRISETTLAKWSRKAISVPVLASKWEMAVNRDLVLGMIVPPCVFRIRKSQGELSPWLRLEGESITFPEGAILYGPEGPSVQDGRVCGVVWPPFHKAIAP